MCQQNQKTGDGVGIRVLCLINSGELALVEIEGWPFKADICFHSDADFGLALTWPVLWY